MIRKILLLYTCIISVIFQTYSYGTSSTVLRCAQIGSIASGAGLVTFGGYKLKKLSAHFDNYANILRQLNQLPSQLTIAELRTKNPTQYHQLQQIQDYFKRYGLRSLPSEFLDLLTVVEFKQRIFRHSRGISYHHSQAAHPYERWYCGGGVFLCLTGLLSYVPIQYL